MSEKRGSAKLVRCKDQVELRIIFPGTGTSSITGTAVICWFLFEYVSIAERRKVLQGVTTGGDNDNWRVRFFSGLKRERERGEENFCKEKKRVSHTYLSNVWNNLMSLGGTNTFVFISNERFYCLFMRFFWSYPALFASHGVSDYARSRNHTGEIPHTHGELSRINNHVEQPREQKKKRERTKRRLTLFVIVEHKHASPCALRGEALTL